MRHDYANARARLRERALQVARLRGKEEGRATRQHAEIESNFALGHLMLAKAHQRLGRDDMAEKYFSRTGELRPDLAAAADPDANRRQRAARRRLRQRPPQDR